MVPYMAWEGYPLLMQENSPLRPLANRPLDNVTCPYCGLDLEQGNTNKEHVISRRLVPKGKFAHSSNLILQACKQCNAKKSDLEDDIPAISLFLLGAMAGEDEALADEVVRKAKESRSRRTQKPVADSSETKIVTGIAFPGMSYRATMVAPPQIDPSRAFELACYQIAGFFYAITYDSTERRGGVWPGICLPLGVVTRGDWGNVVQRWFMTSVKAWHPRVIGPTAEGFYRIALRRHPDPEVMVWSWALEWNKTIRVIGFVGEEDRILKIIQAMPQMLMHEMSDHHRIRLEVPLEAEDDSLFLYPDGFSFDRYI